MFTHFWEICREVMVSSGKMLNWAVENVMFPKVKKWPFRSEMVSDRAQFVGGWHSSLKNKYTVQTIEKTKSHRDHRISPSESHSHTAYMPTDTPHTILLSTLHQTNKRYDMICHSTPNYFINGNQKYCQRACFCIFTFSRLPFVISDWIDA